MQRGIAVGQTKFRFKMHSLGFKYIAFICHLIFRLLLRSRVCDIYGGKEFELPLNLQFNVVLGAGLHPIHSLHAPQIRSIQLR